jgi:hypothetical protein
MIDPKRYPLAWGRHLVTTCDHDPLYPALAALTLRGDGARVRRFMLAYWCCYHVGASALMSARERQDFWDILEMAARNEPTKSPGHVAPLPFVRWPRGPERRHWRGDKCVESVKWLRTRYRDPIDVFLDDIDDRGGDQPKTLEAVAGRIRKWPQFGPWIAFKAADMLERCLGSPVKFRDDTVLMYREPARGAEMLCERLKLASPQAALQAVIQSIDDLPAPGYPGRNCGVQEAETILCKWKSAVNGHYQIGDDIKSHREALGFWGDEWLLPLYPTLPG